MYTFIRTYTPIHIHIYIELYIYIYIYIYIHLLAVLLHVAAQVVACCCRAVWGALLFCGQHSHACHLMERGDNTATLVRRTHHHGDTLRPDQTGVGGPPTSRVGDARVGLARAGSPTRRGHQADRSLPGLR